MANKQDRKGRSKNPDGGFLRLYKWMLRSKAWQHCSVVERALFIAIKERYNGHNNGDIPMSHREAQQLLGQSNKPIIKAFAGLQEKGLIKARVKGSFNWKTSTEGRDYSRATRWEVTDEALDVPTRVLSGASKEFMSWRPPEEQTAVCREHSNRMPTAHHLKKMVCPEHTSEQRVYAHGTQ